MEYKNFGSLNADLFTLSASIITDIDPTSGDNVKEEVMNIWDKLPEAKPFIGIFKHGGRYFYTGFLYYGRLYGVVIVSGTAGFVSVISRYNGSFSWRDVDTTLK